MKYRVNPKNGDKLSALGFGCMRFPRDEKETARLVRSAIENGVNYFDTAYIYPNNEAMLGRALPSEYREEVKIATKLPPYLVRKREDFDKIFNTQLERLKTNYIDYYFMHMLLSIDEWNRLVSLGVLDFIDEKKKNGQIKNVGFSYHGGFDEFKKIADAYAWEFCMLQCNYFDVNSQTGIKGVEYAAGKGIPVMIMEPLRGGTLADRKKMPGKALAVFDEAAVKRSPAEWALRWVWNHPAVLTVLSGMNTQEMLDENIKTASDAESEALTDGELQMFDRAREAILENTYVGCTGCGYCVPCPAGVDIPLCFTCYNDSKLEGRLRAKFYYIMRTNGRNASLCTKCGKCEKHCPQGIKIRDELAAVEKAFGGFPYSAGRKLVRRFMGLK